MRTVVVCLLVALAACSSGPKSKPPKPAPHHAASSPPPARIATVRVDHAWVRDSTRPNEETRRRAAMEALRANVEAGLGFTEAWQRLEVDGKPWHVAEDETYPYDVVPAAARDLPVGTLSAIIPGNGGLHLFRILGREPGR